MKNICYGTLPDFNEFAPACWLAFGGHASAYFIYSSGYQQALSTLRVAMPENYRWNIKDLYEQCQQLLHAEDETGWAMQECEGILRWVGFKWEQNAS